MLARMSIFYNFRTIRICVKVAVCLILKEGSGGQKHLMGWKYPILVQNSVRFSVLSQELGDDAIPMATGETLLLVDVPLEAQLSKVFCILN